MNDLEFPRWMFGPDGAEGIFQTKDEVPKGWSHKHTPETIARVNGWRMPEKPAKIVEKAATGKEFDHNGDGRPGGSAAPELTDELAALRAEYRSVVGKRPFPGWDADEIKRRMAEHKPEIDITEF
ncbi:hypothetical protein RZS08_12290 [Arthrospira platensis SPKY1]|nr:hypothetical protein [Arthrospira platensis SPKY1]